MLTTVTSSVVRQHEVAQGMHLLELSAPAIAREGRPGQFVMVDCPGEASFLRRPLALQSIRPREGVISVLYSVVGTGTGELSHLKGGEEVSILGPLGHAVAPPASARHIVAIAGGIGIASLTALMDEAVAAGKRVTLLHGGRNNALMYPAHLLPKGVKELTATDDGSAGHRGFVTHLLPHVEADADWIVACGPTPMFRTLAHMLKEGAVSKPITALLELRMGCGFGACYGCTVVTPQGGRLVCKDGPAFSIADIDWDGPIAPKVH